MSEKYRLLLTRRFHGEELTDAGTDDQLLETFARTHDEAAFATLARRYGPLVLSVCRRSARQFARCGRCFSSCLLVAGKEGAVRSAKVVRWVAGFTASLIAWPWTCANEMHGGNFTNGRPVRWATCNVPRR